MAPGPCCPPHMEPGALHPLVLAVTEKHCGQLSFYWSRAGPVPPTTVLSRTPVSLPLPGPWAHVELHPRAHGACPGEWWALLSELGPGSAS